MKDSDIIISNIIIQDNFITEIQCNALIRLSTIAGDNSNLTSFTKADDEGLVHEITDRVISLINERFSAKTFLYLAVVAARVIGDVCELHCDNLVLDCPTHGANQVELREVGCNCSDAVYKSNDSGCREYTALLYLGSNHKGGQIIFQDGPVSKIYRKEIETIAGRLVVTRNNQFYYHETTRVEQDVRYSLNMWFTSDQAAADSSKYVG